VAGEWPERCVYGRYRKQLTTLYLLFLVAAQIKKYDETIPIQMELKIGTNTAVAVTPSWSKAQG
jgi:hypothetical protein